MFPRPKILPEVRALFSKLPESSKIVDEIEGLEDLEEFDEFDESDKNIFRISPTINICHIFSWEYMTIVMTNLSTRLPTGEDALVVWIRSLQCFVNSICLSMDGADVNITQGLINQLIMEHSDDDSLQNKYTATVIKLRADSQIIVNNLVEVAQQYTRVFSSSLGGATAELNSLEGSCHKLSANLLNVLCSMPTNLKMGDTSWNKSIGLAVDPRSWVFSKESYCINKNEFLTWNVPSESARPTIVKQFHCELTHPVDCEQIMWAFQIDEKFVQPVTYLYTGIYVNQDEDEDEEVLTVCSSSNPFARVDTTIVPQKVPIYTYDRLSGKHEQRY